MPDKSVSYWTNIEQGLRAVELRAAGFEPSEAAAINAVVTIAAAHTNAHRCNNRVRRIADFLVDALSLKGGQGLLVGAPAVSDALTQGTDNAGYSLVSRDLMADCMETGHYAHHGNAMIVVSGCDKTGAAALMPLARTNAFGLVVYPGTSTPGRVDFEPWASKGNNLTLMDYMEGSAAREAGRISDDQLTSLQRCVMPGSGTCGAMFTANTMSTIAEAIGMMLPRGASHPADYDAGSDIHDDVKKQAHASVDALYRLMEMGLRPRDIMVRKAFENAVTTAYAMGGSTNLYLHVLAIAREAGVMMTIEDLQCIGERVPLIANLQPHGPYAMVSLHKIGGIPVVMKTLLNAGLLHGDVMTVTGKTLTENLAEVALPEDLPKQDVVFQVAQPLAAPGNHISVLSGSLAPESCVLKLSGKTLKNEEFRGKAKVFNSEQAAMKAIREGGVIAGDVVVVRNVGPVGAPGMPEMVHLTIQLQGRGLGKEVALITDGRFSGVSHGILVGHICPEGARGGPISIVRDGDTVVINPRTRRLDIDITPDEMADRMALLGPPELSDLPKGSVLDKYRRLVSSAHYGCVL